MNRSLLHFDCTLGAKELKVTVQALIDSGASHSFISPQVLEKLGTDVSVRTRKKELEVALPNGSCLRTRTSAFLPVRIGSWTGSVKAWVLDLADHAFILGHEFLRTQNPQFDWTTSYMTIRDSQNRHHRVAPSKSARLGQIAHAELHLMSGKQVRRLTRKKETETTLFVIRKKESDPKGPNTEIPRHPDPRVQKILDRHPLVFRKELPNGLPPKRPLEHRIDTGTAAPINLNSYPMSKEKLDEQLRQVEKLLELGLIRPSSSPWGFPVIFVKKPMGEWRMCIDYRALNEVTAKNGYPLPRIQDLLDLVGTSRVLSKIDLTSGYWQIRMDEDSIEKTAFNTIWGKYEWLAMPFGLCNAPATFQTTMNETLRSALGRYALVYLDDILIFSETIEQHCQHLDEILTLLEQQGLIAKPGKCKIATTELEFCGHIVGNRSVRPMPAKVEAIRDWPAPTNVHEVRQFLGLATYYRRFIKRFAHIAAPLHELLKETDETARKNKFRPIVWTVACRSAFARLKQQLVNAPVLIQPDLSRPFTIETDASEWALGAVLMQEDENGTLHPVAFDGRKLQGAELNYPTQEKELLAIKHALRLWDRFIDNGHKTTVITDHASLQYMQTTTTYSKRLARWIEEFQEYNLMIKYRKGTEAIVPDAISRRPDFIGDGPANMATNRPTWSATLAAIRTVQRVPEDVWLEATKEFLRSGTPPDDQRTRKAVEHYAQSLSLEGETTEGNERLIFTSEDGMKSPYMADPFRTDLTARLHKEFGHLGWPGLGGVIKPRAWWPSMRADLEEEVRSCPNCQVSQGSKESLEREAAQHMVTAGIQPFERWGIDLIGRLPLTPNGNCWIITAIDYATGWPVARAVPDATEETLAKFLHDDIFALYGAPKELLSDNGPNLLAGAVRHYVQLLGTRHRTTTPYHPRTNGKVENLNGLLGRMLTKYLMGKPTKAWDLFLSQALFSARVRTHSVTGFSPFYLVYGTLPRIPSDKESLGEKGADREVVLQNLNDARTKANELLLNRAIRTNRIRDSMVTKTSFQEGSWVLVRNESGKKFESKWFGPYRVIQAHPLGTYALEEPSGRVLRNLVNGSRLIEATVDDPKRMWASTAARSALRRAGLRLERPEELQKVLDEEETPPTYSDLSTFTRKEWEESRRAGARSSLAEEGNAVADRVLAKSRANAKRKSQKATAQPVDDHTELEEWDSEANDYESVISDASGSELEEEQPARDAERKQQVQFDGPFAVVI